MLFRTKIFAKSEQNEPNIPCLQKILKLDNSLKKKRISKNLSKFDF